MRRYDDITVICVRLVAAAAGTRMLLAPYMTLYRGTDRVHLMTEGRVQPFLTVILVLEQSLDLTSSPHERVAQAPACNCCRPLDDVASVPHLAVLAITRVCTISEGSSRVACRNQT